MEQAMIIVNPTSGKEEGAGYVQLALDILEEQGYAVTVMETQQEGDATLFSTTACKQGYGLVVSIGGDGTLHEVINGLSGEPDCPKLGVIPLGTVNDFARAIGLSLNPEEAIRTLASPATRAVDVGQLNGRLFINVVAAGAIAESVSAVTSEDKSRFGSLAYFRKGLKELTGNAPNHLTITYDGQVWEGDSPLFIAALTNSVGGFERLAPGAAVDDGLIHCFVIKDLTILSTLSVSISLLLGNLKNHRDVEYFTARSVTAESAAPMRTNVDGEEGPALPVQVSVLPRHIRVVVPEEETG
ncbi:MULTISPECIES: diacylglycerol kinase family protein [unclassified Paenibacillus]|uniref:diacylglycerol/lipid kinase family protein n=1 Tax=unclassified Paenibacillus TaxID=185978 RepID=UPI0024058763|nr:MULTISPECIES: diacylglycerol kinase family protein [unclassified Paenibacillus]MDF9839867.1 diacylglycerol kinase (ATP) [Paenibacillus sp. PastF-2]MDF9846448.1 diacylglycerol kinase (ATP) [Paenibacillus sp. PastM-2]MDF9853203.1 diacylglycerol kinase (ATP) [Paenibacillus sp. PastF-1]MDH6478293.1 diacylglycerol kinase (ATP) [Paenibacillus sp. PastH-2]MDH6506208.1 diacylglycerol kinase (ATP) [Paenibacillus sp. PastM-3]